MSKIKNIILKTILVTMLTAVAILSAQTQVEAIRLPFGQTSVIAGGRGAAGPGAQCIDGQPGNNTFCVVNGRALSTERYNVANYISIDGQTAKVYRGNTNEESAKIGEYVRPENAAMAWILAQEDTGSWPYQSVYSLKQKAVYTYFPTWKMVVGLGDFATNVYSQNTNYDWVRKAQKYAETITPDAKSTDTAHIEDRTEKVTDRLPVEINGVEMINVGPFKVEYKGDIETFVVKDQNDAPIEGALIGKYEGTELKTSSKASDIVKSGEDFYVLVPGDGSVTAINGIDIGVFYEQHVVSAEIWTLQRQASWKQNLITTEANEKTVPTRDSVTIPGKPVVDTPTPLTPTPATPTPETPTPGTPTPGTPTPGTPTPGTPTPPTPTPGTPTPPGPEVPTTTRLQVVKINEDAKEFRISGVGFVFQLESTGKYLKRLENPTETSNFEFVDNREDATVFVTDENGEINEDNVLVGKYIAYEVSNTHYGYEVKPEGTKIEVREDDGVIKTNIIENKQRWIKLSGYVWEDIAINKAGERDDLFQDNSYDYGDKLMEGIKVRLKDITTGETVQEALTDENGAYLFENVEIDKLDDYYIEFEYNGLVYTNVIKHIDLDNGSKAEEGEEVRKEFNERFNSVEGDSNSQAENTGVTKGKDGNVTYNLKYIRGEGEDVNKSFLDYESLEFPITANTENAGYDIYSHFSYGYVEEIKYINLGLYRREQPDLAIIKDVQNGIVGINGYNHTYNYNLKPTEDYTKTPKEGFNIGVRFQSEMSRKYKRAIYKSDATFIDENQNKDNELKVAVTYKISFINQSTNLGARVNSILDYYDAKYGKVYKVGSQIDEKGMITDDSTLQFEDGTYNEKYNLVKITTPDTIIEPGKSSKKKNESTGEVEEKVEEYNTMEVYVQFLMDRETVQKILVMNENEDDPEGPLENVAEIGSYTTFDKEGNVYAGVDKDSAPGNVTPDDVNTYEDDTDLAPGFILQYGGGNRYTTGNVFEDLPEGAKFANNATVPGESRIGDGKFNASTEPGIAGINVRLVEAEVDENGKPTSIPKLDASGNPVIAKDYSQNSENTNPIDPNDPNNYKEITATSIAGTGEDAGTYKLEGFVPGKYLIQFIWGGKTYYADLKTEGLSDEEKERVMKYSAEDFKSTTQPAEEWNRKMSNPEWYKEYKEDLTQDPRYTDAQDSQEIRQQIDSRIKHQVYENTNKTDKSQLIDMISTTAPMDVTVEFTDLNVTETEINGGTTKDVMLSYEVPHVDFGIIERARQDLKLSKHVSRIKLILKDNKPLVDATISEDGQKVEGVQDSLVYLPSTGKNDNGRLKIELDKEIAQRSTLEVEYKFEALNNSEMDYDDIEFYNYGTPSSSAKVRTLSADQIIDYLDNDWGYDPEVQNNIDNKWKLIEKETLVNNHTFENPETEPKETLEMFSKEVKESEGLNKVKLLETDILKKDLKPTESAIASLTVSKVLDPDGEIELSNEAEVTHVYKDHGGRNVTSTPGNYIPALSLEEVFDAGTGNVKPELASNVEEDSSMAETTTIVPPTGSDSITYVMIIGAVVISLTILATGIVIIKKKVLTK